jgi:hypothetical protein
VLHAGEPEVVPAGFACPFDVLWTPQGSPGFHIVTSFSDGRVITVGHGEPTITNLDTEESYVNRSRYEITEIYDEAANDVLARVTAALLLASSPAMRGRLEKWERTARFTASSGTSATRSTSTRRSCDFDTEVLTSFELLGTATDICAILAAD